MDTKGCKNTGVNYVKYQKLGNQKQPIKSYKKGTDVKESLGHISTTI